MLKARTNAEAHLYMDLHPCESCGKVEFARDNKVVADGGDLVSVYTGACAGCGTERSFEFAVPEKVLPPTQPMSYGGDAASEILDPGEFIDVSDTYAKAIPGAPEGLDAAALRQARARLDTAIAALREVLKFIPEGADCVPEGAFTSERGRKVYAAEPGRFRKLRLDAVLGAYTGLATKFGGA